MQQRLANIDGFLFSSARFGDEGVDRDVAEDMIDRFAGAVSGVVVENYADNLFLDGFSEAVGFLQAEGIQVHTLENFEADVDRSVMIDYYDHAAGRGYIPSTAIGFDYDSFPALPVFNEVTNMDDVLAGDATDNVISGQDGNDQITGGDGSDTLNGGAGDDVLYGHSLADLDPASGLITTMRVASGFDLPVLATYTPGDADALYVLEQKTGKIMRIDPDSNAAPTVFLDIPDAELGAGREGGALGLAFHPDYETNGRFFVHMVDAAGDVAIREYARDAGASLTADPASMKAVITIPHPTNTNHNGGTVAFSADGMLHISVGDGGGALRVNGQDTGTLLGTILRINVDGDDFAGDAARNYAIPLDNPFVEEGGAAEIWHYGLRNPYRFSIDADTGDMYIGDVGQREREEIDFAANGIGGLNFGWDIVEGTLPFDPGQPGEPQPGDPALTDPVFEYDHDIGRSVTGGVVNHEPTAGLQGAYVFGDFVTGAGFALRVIDGEAQQVIRLDDRFTGDLDALFLPSSFGTDAQGRVFVTSFDGGVYRLDAAVAAGDGNDVLNGGAEDDTLYGGIGDDRLIGGTGNDALDGGMGNDTLRGDGGNDNLRGEAGNDVMSGGADNDVVNGGDGKDVMFGGSGDDLMFGGAGFDKMFGGIGFDRMFGGKDNDIANGGADNDIINTGAGNDLIFAQNGNDLVFAQAGNDTVFGGVGNDSVFGGAGNDTINVGAGNDKVFGGAGADRITGAGGDDTLSGGGGSDIFVFAADQGADTVTDYTGADRLDISAFGVTDGAGSDTDWRGATASVGTSGGGTNVVIVWDGGGTLRLENTVICDLTDSDFLF